MTGTNQFKYKPTIIKCHDCGEEFTAHNASKKTPGICGPCEKIRGLHLNKPNGAFGCTVIQDKEEIAKAWAAAMGDKRFTSLVYR